MKRRIGSLITTLIIVFVLWQFWQKVHFVVWLQVPWWGILLLIIGLFVVLDLLMDRLFGEKH